MSLWSDCEIYALLERNFPHGINNDEWTTKNGTVIHLKDMTDSHIINVMRMIGKKDDFWYACESELRKRMERSEE